MATQIVQSTDLCARCRQPFGTHADGSSLGPLCLDGKPSTSDHHYTPCVRCACGHVVSLPVVKGLPIRAYTCLCRRQYTASGQLLT